VKLPFFLASRFVAGETLDETLAVVRTLSARGFYVALDLLGEYVDELEVADAARDAYIGLVHTIANDPSLPRRQANISIKLSMMGQKIDYDYCLGNLRQLLAVAKDKDVFVRLDMEGSDITESTLSLFEAVYPEYPDHVGVVLQAYLKRTEADVRRMCELNARVRLCKGAYREPPEIAYQRMDQIRERFTAYMKQLLTDGRYPGIATHDDLRPPPDAGAARAGRLPDARLRPLRHRVGPLLLSPPARTEGEHLVRRQEPAEEMTNVERRMSNPITHSTFVIHFTLSRWPGFRSFERRPLSCLIRSTVAP
jgi:proline dehydrogenase